jgi:hypothetical protein
MSFELLPDEKFAVLALRNASTEYFARQLELDLGGGLWIINTTPFDVGATWREWVGSIHSDEIARANLWIIAKQVSRTPSIMDAENEELKLGVWQLFLGLLVLGSPFYEHGYVLTGAHVAARAQIREYSESHHFLVSEPGEPHLSIGEGHLRRALTVRAGLGSVFDSDAHMRVRRGLHVFWDGLKQNNPIARLHQFVRATEAIVNPRIGSTKGDMIHRCQTFIGRSPEAAAVLGECYDLRSKEEHLWNWEDALPNVPSDQKHATMIHRVRQAEALARHVYSHILTSGAHLAEFADGAIDGCC